MNDCYFAIRAALTVMRSVDYLRIEADNGLTALAELERAAAEPVAWMYDKGDEEGLVTPFNPLTTPGHGGRKNIRPLYAAPPAPVAEIRDVVVTDEMCDRAYIGKWRGVPELIGHEPDDEDRQWAREWLEAWRAELGPALGLVEIREPSDAECIAINEHVLRAHGIEGCGAVLNGRVIFDAVAKWLKGEL